MTTTVFKHGFKAWLKDVEKEILLQPRQACRRMPNNNLVTVEVEYVPGDLRFPEFGSRTYRAPTGGAVVFSCSLLHEALPVTKGRRYAFLPFFYDEEAKKIREENLQYLDL